MSPRPAAERRALGLWTASCLAVLLAVGVTRLGDWSLQWPVLAVPLIWALVALRPRRGALRRRDETEDDAASYWDAPDHWGEEGNPYLRPHPERTDTVEAPWVRDERYRPPD
jgi:hypothetical protein